MYIEAVELAVNGIPSGLAVPVWHGQSAPIDQPAFKRPSVKRRKADRF
jgi:hypothetical protein